MNLNLIHVFSFYLTATFLVSCYRRFGLYRAVGGLIIDVPTRWPKLFELIRGQRAVFFTWTTLLPAILALLVLLTHTIACQLVWPWADVKARDLLDHMILLPLVLIPALAMLGLDVYTILTVGSVDRPEVEKQLDRAEYWLTNWKGRAVSLLTFGRLDPRQMVAVEVRKSLGEAARLLNRSLWWVSMQTALRVVFGLSLWLAWAIFAHHEKSEPQSTSRITFPLPFSVSGTGRPSNSNSFLGSMPRME